ncbi:MAG: WecB/TagA/CpsF family glycosyltransferase, partial [Pseudomonadota bacterium]
FLAGAQVRAPMIFQRCNLEWVWRLARDPGRLSRRYLDAALAFPGVMLAAWRRR